MAVKLLAAVCSDKGCVRQNNEDNFCLNGHYLRREQMDMGGLFKCRTGGQALFAVCDGMGGEAAGEEASLLAVTCVADRLSTVETLFDVDELKKFLHLGCEAVCKRARELGNRAGATIGLLIASSQGFRIANLGDSRIYRLHAGQMNQISVDHTEMQRLLDQGRIKREEIKTHPKRHMIYQYLGMPLDRAPFTPHISGVIPYVQKDRFLLCSDGLTDMLTDAEIESVLSKNETVEYICQELVRKAKSKGGRDNVTVCVIEVANAASDRTPVKRKNLQGLYVKKRMWIGILGVLIPADLYLIFEWIDWLLFH